MHDSPLAAWESFYVIVGSSAAALTGLQFVVIALLSDTHRRPSVSEGIDAFSTPTVVHFSAILLVACILSAPWPGLAAMSLALGATGAAGFIYGVIVIKRTRGQTVYKPVFEDWLFHSVLPNVTYATLVIAALTMLRHTSGSLFVVAAAELLLMFVAIHNAWDTATYVTIDMNRHGNPGEERAVPPRSEG